MLKMRRPRAQIAEMPCSKCRDVVLKSQRWHAQNVEMSCSNAETSRSKCRELVQNAAQNNSGRPHLRTARVLLYYLVLTSTLAEGITELREGTPDLNSFWPMVRSICAQLKCHYNTDDLHLAEWLILRAEECTSVLRAISTFCA